MELNGESNMNFYMDLHCHTFPESTDATQSYFDLIQTAKRNGIQYLSITNHDSIENQDIFQKEAEKQGIKYLKGVEITCVLDDLNILGYEVKIDVLAYNCSWSLDDFKTFIKQYKEENDIRFKQRKSILEKEFSIDLSSAKKADRELAELLLKNNKFSSLRDAKHFIQLSPLLKAFQKKHVSFKDTVQTAKKFGGTLIMAHPFRKTLKKLGPFTVPEMQRLMPYYQSLGVDGFEPYHIENMEKDHYLILLNYLKQQNMLVSIGSDRHGIGDPNKPHFLFDIHLDINELEKTKKILFKS
jgi:predicted metal-dependent phosphoesterase TrpH